MLHILLPVLNLSFNKFNTKPAGLCSGKLRIGKIKDFDTSLEERMREYDKKREEEKYELISQGICPQCGCYLKIRHGRYGEFFGCSNYPHCQFTFSYDEE